MQERTISQVNAEPPQKKVNLVCTDISDQHFFSLYELSHFYFKIQAKLRKY